MAHTASAAEAKAPAPRLSARDLISSMSAHWRQLSFDAQGTAIREREDAAPVEIGCAGGRFRLVLEWQSLHEGPSSSNLETGGFSSVFGHRADRGENRRGGGKEYQATAAVFRLINTLLAVARMRPKKNAQKTPIPGEVPMLCRISGSTVGEALFNLRLPRTALQEYLAFARTRGRAQA